MAFNEQYLEYERLQRCQCILPCTPLAMLNDKDDDKSAMTYTAVAQPMILSLYRLGKPCLDSLACLQKRIHIFELERYLGDRSISVLRNKPSVWSQGSRARLLFPRGRSTNLSLLPPKLSARCKTGTLGGLNQSRRRTCLKKHHTELKIPRQYGRHHHTQHGSQRPSWT